MAKRRHDFFWPFNQEPDSFLDPEFSFDYYGQKRSDWSTERWRFESSLFHKAGQNRSYRLGIGFDSLTIQDVGERHSQAALVAIGDYWRRWEKLAIQLGFKSGYHFDQILYFQARQEMSRGVRAHLRTNWDFTERAQLTLQSWGLKLDDENSAHFLDLEMSWRLSFDPWIKLGIGYQHLGFRQFRSDYWSPVANRAYGLRGEVSFPLLEKTQLFAGGSLSRIREEERAEGSGFYLRSGLSYGERDAMLVKISYEAMRSRQNGRSWTADGAQIELAFDY